ncbi:LysR family transcriptional regulator [Marinobacterium sedimentorum]|uniref:LysR family transcriptional regulator n=1 Tax=Marinobacterium sedimentorum TaxID=2927804 RepID=UPI0020C7121E|nr:LysR family transcriptional regulator [Marinobacterium sedimentorum]MCP8689830.1 LysR family transcriptional regulator [Marinobacterium sedimentorum]
MNLDNLRYFVRVVEANSFTAAAERLGTQKSTLSRRISQLEDELGIRLLQRTTRKLHLTPDGEELFERCRPLICQLEDARHRLSVNQPEPQGRLKLTMPTELALAMLDNIIASFMQQYPKIQMEVELTSRVLDMVEEGIDVAIRVGALEDSSLIAQPVAQVARGLYAAPEYLQQRPALQSPHDLQQHRYLGLLQRSDPLHFDNWDQSHSLQMDTPLRTNSLNFMRYMARRGFGIARLPCFFAQPLVDSGELEAVLRQYPVPSIAINALYPSRQHLNPKTRLFLDHLHAELRQHPWASDALIQLPGANPG